MNVDEIAQVQEALASGQKHVLEMIATGAPLTEVLEVLVRFIEEQANGMLCSILLLDKDGVHLRHGEGPSLPDSYNQAVDGVAIGPNAGSCGAAAYHRQEVTASDIASDPRWVDYRDLALSHGLRACWSTPIFSTNGQVLGTFAIYYREPRSPTAQDRLLINLATHIAGIAIERKWAEEALRENEARLRLMTEQIPAHMWTTDTDLRVTSISGASLAQIGHAPSQYLGKTLDEAITIEEQKSKLLTAHLCALQGEPAEYEVEVADRIFEARVEPLRDAQDKIVGCLGLALDVTERKRNERRLATQYAVSRVLAEAANLDEAILKILQVIGEQLEWDYGALWSVDGHDNVLRCVRTWYTPAMAFAEFEAITRQTALTPGVGLPGSVWARGEFIWISDTAKEPSFPQLQLAAFAGLHAGFGLPIILNGKVIGVLEFLSRRVREPDRDSLELMAALGRQIGQFIERKRAEEALRETEERLRTVIANSLIVVFAIDHEGVFTLSEGKGLEALGLKSGEVAGRSVFEVYRDVPEILEHTRRALAGEEYTAIDHVAGLAFETHWAPIHDQDGQVMGTMGVATDITKRKQAEEALRESEARFRRLAENATDIIYRYCLTPTPGFDYVSPAVTAITGYTPEEHYADPDLGFKLVHPDDRALLESILESPPASGEAIRIRWLRKDGTVIWTEHQIVPIHDAVGNVVAIEGIARDITERVQAYQFLEQRVTERTQELSTLLEVSKDVASTLELQPLLALILDHLKAMIDYTSAAIFALQGEELAVLDYRGPLSDAQGGQIHSLLIEVGIGREVIGRRGPIIISDIRGSTPLARAFRKRSSEYIHTTLPHIRSWIGVPLIIKKQVIGMLSLASSKPNYYTPRHAVLALAIARQAAVAIENAKLYEQAQELAVLEERQRLARELHDSVSQALYGIALGTHTARDALVNDPNEAVEPLEYVLSLAQAGLAEMRALLFELRPESLESEGLVAALVKQARALHARYGIMVQAELGAEPTLPLTIKEGLYRIAQEALHNTVKHARASRVDLRLAHGTAAVVLEVHDNGMGFDPAQSFAGHLGLLSMRERAIRLGGRLEIESAPGQGTHIRVQIPHHREDE